VIGTLNKPRGRVLKAQSAIRRARRGDTRAIKVQLQDGNPYVVRWLHRNGCVYLRGTGIVRVRQP
jgi:hypothetical protein